jgi:predicted permease
MSWFTRLFSRGRLHGDLSEEIRAHLDEKIDELMKGGLNRKQAAEVAHREFGNPTTVEQDSREVWQWPTIESLFADLRYGIRMLRRNPGFSLTVVVILAVGIGANAAVFSIVDSTLLKPLPYADQERLMMLRNNGDRDTKTPMSFPAFQAWKAHKEIFDAVGAYFIGSSDLTSPGEPQQFGSIRVSTDLLPMLGINLQAGRGFTPQEELRAGPPVVIVSNSFWRNRLDADPSALGRTLTLNDRVFTVIGILPPDFHFSSDPDLVLPLRLTAQMAAPQYNSLQVIGKLHAGLTVQQARNAAIAITNQVNDAASNAVGIAVSIVPLREVLVGDSRPLLLALLGTVTFVLLIVCANTANLLLARASTREKEIAIRIALGAARIRLIRQLLTESLLLAVLGGAMGLCLAQWGLGLLADLLGDRLPRSTDIHLDGYVLLFIGALSILTGILFGIAPALQAGRQNLADRLKVGGRLSGGPSHSQVIRNVLIVGEIAFSLVLLTGTGLLVRSFIRLANVNKGFDAEHVLTMHLEVSPGKYGDPVKEINYLNQIVQSAKALPGVESAGFITNLPFSGNAMSGDYLIEGVAPDPANLSNASKQFVVGDYFRSMHMTLIKGRFLSDRDNAEARPAVVVDEGFVRRYFPHEDPIGKRIDVGWGKRGWSEIVGVVGDAREFALTESPIPTIYSQVAQKPELLEFLSFDLAIRSSLSPSSQVRAVNDQIHKLDATQIISRVRTMNDLIGTKLASRRDPMWLFGMFSTIALFLSAVGIYGVLSYYVIQRGQEIGTRIALGAQRVDILKLILGHAVKLVVAGMAIGLVISLLIARALSSLLFGVQPTDLPTFLGVSVLLGTLALVACAVPALRATRVDPLIVLRNN